MTIRRIGEEHHPEDGRCSFSYVQGLGIMGIAELSDEKNARIPYGIAEGLGG